jgi:hypothetical protein
MVALKADAPAANVLAYEDDPVRAAPLAYTKGYITFIGWDNKRRVGRVPDAWFELRLQRWGWWNVTADKPIIFAHLRKTRSGVERVLVVYAVPSWPKNGTHVKVDTLIVDAVGDAWNPPDRWDATSSVALSRDGSSHGNGLRIFAGQADPKDASHFTIEYEIDGVKGVLDGWLQDRRGPNDQEDVILQRR